MEWPALFKRDGLWHAFGSDGHLSQNDTIWGCRRDAPDPTGSDHDREGLECTCCDDSRQRCGPSMLLDHEGYHTLPGHLHLWTEGDVTIWVATSALAWPMRRLAGHGVAACRGERHSAKELEAGAEARKHWSGRGASG